MSDIDPKALIVRAADMKGSPEESFVHPLNPSSQIYGTSLGKKVGLKRVGISYVTVPAGKESFAFHAHHADEEWVFILAGRGIAEIADEAIEVAPGDFVGYPTGVPHNMRNPHDEDLVYLMGGESNTIEIADFPRHNKRLVRMENRAQLHPLDTAEPFWSAEEDR
jgi:uncharacterized cupin superfamily protein